MAAEPLQQPDSNIRLTCTFYSYLLQNKKSDIIRCN